MFLGVFSSGGPQSYSKGITNEYRPSNVHPRHNARQGAGMSNEKRAAMQMIKSFDTMSFDHALFAYFLSENASGPVLKNVFSSFEALVTVMANNLDNENINDHSELEVAILSKRIIDGLTAYRNEA